MCVPTRIRKLTESCIIVHNASQEARSSGKNLSIPRLRTNCSKPGRLAHNSNDDSIDEIRRKFINMQRLAHNRNDNSKDEIRRNLFNMQEFQYRIALISSRAIIYFEGNFTREYF